MAYSSRNHLRTQDCSRSNCDLEINVAFFWNLLNEQNFGRLLKVSPQFRVWDTDKAHGYFHPDWPRSGECLIEIDIKKHFASGMSDPAAHLILINTLLHEMCHQAQWENGLPMGHNESFESFAKTSGLT